MLLKMKPSRRVSGLLHCLAVWYLFLVSLWLEPAAAKFSQLQPESASSIAPEHAAWNDHLDSLCLAANSRLNVSDPSYPISEHPISGDIFCVQECSDGAQADFIVDAGVTNVTLVVVLSSVSSPCSLRVVDQTATHAMSVFLRVSGAQTELYDVFLSSSAPLGYGDVEIAMLSLKLSGVAQQVFLLDSPANFVVKGFPGNHETVVGAAYGSTWDIQQVSSNFIVLGEAPIVDSGLLLALIQNNIALSLIQPRNVSVFGGLLDHPVFLLYQGLIFPGANSPNTSAWYNQVVAMSQTSCINQNAPVCVYGALRGQLFLRPHAQVVVVNPDATHTSVWQIDEVEGLYIQDQILENATVDATGGRYSADGGRWSLVVTNTMPTTQGFAAAFDIQKPITSLAVSASKRLEHPAELVFVKPLANANSTLSWTAARNAALASAAYISHWTKASDQRTLSFYVARDITQAPQTMSLTGAAHTTRLALVEITLTPSFSCPNGTVQQVQLAHETITTLCNRTASTWSTQMLRFEHDRQDVTLHINGTQLHSLILGQTLPTQANANKYGTGIPHIILTEAHALAEIGPFTKHKNVYFGAHYLSFYPRTHSVATNMTGSRSRDGVVCFDPDAWSEDNAYNREKWREIISYGERPCISFQENAACKRDAVVAIWMEQNEITLDRRDATSTYLISAGGNSTYNVRQYHRYVQQLANAEFLLAALFPALFMASTGQFFDASWLQQWRVASLTPYMHGASSFVGPDLFSVSRAAQNAMIRWIFANKNHWQTNAHMTMEESCEQHYVLEYWLIVALVALWVLVGLAVTLQKLTRARWQQAIGTCVVLLFTLFAPALWGIILALRHESPDFDKFGYALFVISLGTLGISYIVLSFRSFYPRCMPSVSRKESGDELEDARASNADCTPTNDEIFMLIYAPLLTTRLNVNVETLLTAARTLLIGLYTMVVPVIGSRCKMQPLIAVLRIGEISTRRLPVRQKSQVQNMERESEADSESKADSIVWWRIHLLPCSTFSRRIVWFIHSVEIVCEVVFTILIMVNANAPTVGFYHFYVFTSMCLSVVSASFSKWSRQAATRPEVRASEQAAIRPEVRASEQAAIRPEVPVSDTTPLLHPQA